VSIYINPNNNTSDNDETNNESTDHDSDETDQDSDETDHETIRGGQPQLDLLNLLLNIFLGNFYR
jgi:hypothetical protein